VQNFDIFLTSALVGSSRQLIDSRGPFSYSPTIIRGYGCNVFLHGHIEDD